MSERDGYEHGVPCWVSGTHADPEAAAAFYADLMGWEAREEGPARMFSLRGRDVAGLLPSAGAAAWRTYVWVDDAEAAARDATAAGGSVLEAPADLRNAGRAAVLADPAGAPIGVFQPGAHRGAGRVNEPGAWAMSALATADADAAIPFYGTLFGWDMLAQEFDGMTFTMFTRPGYVGGEPSQPVPRDVIAVLAPPVPDAPPQWSAGFWVDDADAAARRAERLGGTVLMPPTDSPVGRTTAIADPQGATLTLSRVVPA
jgi:predicted enzyme related to lactoylglutathione lyase